MANQFFIPFNYDPIETTVETTTYSLAAGKYARVTPIGFEAALVINSESVFPRLYYTFTDTETSGAFVAFDGLSAADVAGYCKAYVSTKTSNAASTAEVEVRDPNGGAVYTGSTASTTYQPVAADFTWNENFSIYHKNASHTTTTSVTLVPGVFTPPKFWAHGGASGITITGDRFIIELYNSIS